MWFCTEEKHVHQYWFSLSCKLLDSQIREEIKQKQASLHSFVNNLRPSINAEWRTSEWTRSSPQRTNGSIKINVRLWVGKRPPGWSILQPAALSATANWGIRPPSGSYFIIATVLYNCHISICGFLNQFCSSDRGEPLFWLEHDFRLNLF